VTITGKGGEKIEGTVMDISPGGAGLRATFGLAEHGLKTACIESDRCRMIGHCSKFAARDWTGQREHPRPKPTYAIGIWS
ncbi:MAG: hypothetical protein IIC79_06630, partial [Chloroflexi bacterium]|nr:hypothetical protein [Chloroflexota bacterium]